MVVLIDAARLVRVGLSFVVPYRTSLRKGFILPVGMRPAYSAFGAIKSGRESQAGRGVLSHKQRKIFPLF